ncbi:MAG: sulfotransferase [Paracoccus sp. (in: a-proteobacteria)]|uniref:sulfotransferase n=1 Tax=Paracoccus sp. TaxID=267 RepID=UPI0026E0CFDD|nr:sulfotransferase [Paracoccus sp. (in: a-proteobacteria)]MDO5612676.1 sulfotransferase [Paracoccus sp. (in: a-proteobacteria)]
MHAALLLGSARCGSTLVSQIIRQHPDVLSLSELFIGLGPYGYRPDRCDGRTFWRHLTQPTPLMRRLANPDTMPDEFLYHRVENRRHDPFNCPPVLNIMLPHLTDRPDDLLDALGAEVVTWPLRPLADQYLALFAALDRLVPGGPRKVWAERSGGSLVAVRTLRRMFPQARLVLLRRNGAATALSLRQFTMARAPVWLWKTGLPWVNTLNPRHHFGRGPFWPLLCRMGGLPGVNHLLTKRPSVVDCGRFWSDMMQTAVAELRGADVTVIRYEQLLADPPRQIVRLGMAVAGNAPPGWVAATAHLPMARVSQLDALSPADRRALLAACEPGEAALDMLGR